jgi:hypothetical protein
MPLFTSPHAADGEWLRGNLHSHTTNSDGTRPAEEVIGDYESRGYDFLAISDHDFLTDPTPYRANTSLLLLPGVEVSARGPHVLHIGATALIEPDENRQTVLDNIAAQDALGILNHPNWGRNFNHFPHERMEALEGYVGIEIYNGVIERLEGAPLATDRWDRLLSKGRRVWGFGNDDAHAPVDFELAWNVVRVTERTPEAIIAALRTGNFYASTGVEITDITVQDGVFRVVTTNANRIRFFTQHGVCRQTTDGTAAEYILPTTDDGAKRLLYVRAECYGTGGRMAWTQPAFAEVETA